MKIGILNADELAAVQIQKYGDYSDMLQNLILCVETDHKFKTYHVTQGNYPADIDECDAYIITGSKASAYDTEQWVSRLKDYIKLLFRGKKKLIGICFGHQVTAEALGGRVKKSEKGWGVGIKTSTVLQHKSWMKPGQVKIALRHSHQDQVITLPDNAELILTNNFCPNSSYQINEHILTFQGHPEFSNDFLTYLMNGRQKMIGEANYQQAITSLQQNADDKLITKWMLEFIKAQ